MTWRVHIEAQAEVEILEAATWYRQRNPLLGDRFLIAVENALARIADNPLQFQIIRGRVRRVMIRGFRYALLYSIADTNDVVVTVCIHMSRNPEHWQRRFP